MDFPGGSLTNIHVIVSDEHRSQIGFLADCIY